MYANSLSNLYGTDYIYNHSVVNNTTVGNSETIGNDLNVIDTVTCAILVINSVSNFSTSGIVFSKELSMENNKIINLTTPSALYDAANKKYVDDSITGLSTVYATITVLSNYVTSSYAASTFATQSSLTSYLSQATAASIYLAKADLSSLSYSIVPSVNLNYDLGSSSFYYSNVYSNNLVGETYKIGKNLSLSNLYIAHSSHFSGTNYAFAQTSSGDTYINCNSANSIQLMYNGGNSLMSLNYNATANQITVYGNLFPSSNNVYSLGTTSAAFLNVFASALVGSGTSTYKLGGLSSIMYLSHSSNFTTNNYAVSQNASGATVINAASGQTVRILNNGASILFSFSSTACTTYQNIVPTTTNTLSCGSASLLYTAIYATNGTIQTSDLNMKTNIANLSIKKDVVCNFIKGLRPVTFQWNSGPEQNLTHCGFIAQEIDSLCDQLDFMENDIAVHDVDENGTEHWGIKISELISPLVLYCQEIPNRLVPDEDDAVDIGSADKRYQDIYLSGQIYLTSDQYQKKDIRDADQDKSIALINLLKAKEYTMVGKTAKRIGFIAQSLEKILYDLDIGHNIVNKTVNKNGTESYALDYMALIPHLVSYSQHLFDKNKRLEARLERLESFISNTNEMLSDIKKTRERTSTLKSPRRTTNP